MKIYIYFLSSFCFFLIENSCYGSSRHDPINLEQSLYSHQHTFSPPLSHSYQDTPSMKPRLNLSAIDAEELSKLPLKELYKISEKEIKQIDPKILEHLTYKYALADKMVKDPSRGTALLRLGALGNCVIAQSEYAHRLWKGEGTQKDGLEALNWYVKAAEAGDIDSIYFLKNAMNKNKLNQYFGENISDELMERIANF